MKGIKIRANQLISNFGPGSVIEISKSSFAITTTDKWNRSNSKLLISERLSEVLGGKELRTSEYKYIAQGNKEFDFDKSFATAVIFPKWHFCNQCSGMKKITDPETEFVCDSCGGDLVPMRWISVCENGHMQDVDWSYYVHFGSKTVCREKNKLKFYGSGKSSGLESLFVECKTCKSKKSIKEIITLADKVGRCFGAQPWDEFGGAKCNAKIKIEQKGASNVHFSYTVKSIDIMPWAYFSDPKIKEITDSAQFGTLLNLDEKQIDLGNSIIQSIFDTLKNEFDISETFILELLQKKRASIIKERTPSKYPNTELKEEEYKAFSEKQLSASQGNLIISDVDFSKYEPKVNNKNFNQFLKTFKNNIKQVRKIERLRMVTAFTGFTRIGVNSNEFFPFYYDEPQKEYKVIPSNNGNGESPKWYPAYENFGEGIFFNINDSALKEWSRNDEVIKRCKIIGDNNFSPEFVMLHSLAHALINQLSFESGYPAASISERIYYNKKEKHFGVLIYTVGDSKGSLGGLARMATQELIIPLFYNALKNSVWCSNDPLCIESQGQGFLTKNLAACHSCLLLPETSCEFMNVYLDRVLLIGNETVNGFFGNNFF